MDTQNVIAVFDVGKTNKKLFLFDKSYNIVFENAATLPETVDEDGEPCEDIDSLRSFILKSFEEVSALKEFNIKAINFCSYGASFVYLNKDGQTFTPLYNYLKEYPESLRKKFYDTYGGEDEFSLQTASPVLGSLNSGMQLYRLKYEKPEVFQQIKYALHLPQYVSYLISSQVGSDITSIGCHTNLWDFQKNNYHQWVQREGLLEKLAPILPCEQVVPASSNGNNYSVGVGLHDSSAALIPYLVSFKEPFVLISTGTWCISLNPFNDTPLTKEELQKDCLCYISYEGKPVKASRLFAGYDHDLQVKRIAEFFNTSPDKYRTMNFNPETISALQGKSKATGKLIQTKTSQQGSLFAEREIADFNKDEEAYHQLMLDIVSQQFTSTQLVLKGSEVKRIFVDGGFSKNEIYMNLLAGFFKGIEVFAATVAQATAVGTALSIHSSWNEKALPNDIIALQYFSSSNFYADKNIVDSANK